MLAIAVAALAGPAHARDPFDVALFARVPAPGSPEGIAVDSKGTVFVGTSPKEGGPGGAHRPSKVFAYDGGGNLRAEYTIAGQNFDEPFYGLFGMAFDGDDFLYAVDRAPARIIRLDPRTGTQSDYARFADVPPCGTSSDPANCSATAFDMAPFPNYPVFAPDGSMYVTDSNQALIWRVPPRGGDAHVWFTHPGLETAFGPNGMQFLDDGHTLLFALTTQGNPTASAPLPAGLYRIAVGGDGDPVQLEQFWQSEVADVPDGLAIAASGNVYVALAGTGNGVAVISPQGNEIARVPGSELANQQLEVPFDQPASAAFLGDNVLVTNHALFSRDPNHYAVLDVFAGEPGLPLFRPQLAAAGDTIRASVRPRRAVAGQRTCFRFRVVCDSGAAVEQARVRFAGKRVRTDEHGRARLCKRPAAAGMRTARVSKPGSATVRLRIRIRGAP